MPRKPAFLDSLLDVYPGTTRGRGESRTPSALPNFNAKENHLRRTFAALATRIPFRETCEEVQGFDRELEEALAAAIPISMFIGYFIHEGMNGRREP